VDVFFETRCIYITGIQPWFSSAIVDAAGISPSCSLCRQHHCLLINRLLYSLPVCINAALLPCCPSYLLNAELGRCWIDSRHSSTVCGRAPFVHRRPDSNTAVIIVINCCVDKPAAADANVLCQPHQSGHIVVIAETRTELLLLPYGSQLSLPSLQGR